MLLNLKINKNTLIFLDNLIICLLCAFNFKNLKMLQIICRKLLKVKEKNLEKIAQILKFMKKIIRIFLKKSIRKKNDKKNK